MKNIASEAFRKRRANCAQAVAIAWQAKMSREDVPVDSLSSCGGGNAPGGLCGALHAACLIAGGERSGAVSDGFKERAGGHSKCREIRSSRALSCVECVELAAALLEEQMPKFPNQQ